MRQRATVRGAVPPARGSGWRLVLLGALGALGTAASGCGAPPASRGADGPAPATAGTAAAGRQEQDTAARHMVPAGFGTLRQEDVAIRLPLQGAQLRAIPLDESIIRTLSPDSYRAMRDLLQSRQADIERISLRHGSRTPSVWFVSFFGLEPEARFSPMELVITSTGRDFRPLDVLPLSPGFGEHRLRQRESQSALYVFEDGLDPNQPLTVSMGAQRNSAWEETLRRIERERAMIRSRAGGASSG